MTVQFLNNICEPLKTTVTLRTATYLIRAGSITSQPPMRSYITTIPSYIASYPATPLIPPSNLIHPLQCGRGTHAVRSAESCARATLDGTHAAPHETAPALATSEPRRPLIPTRDPATTGRRGVDGDEGRGGEVTESTERGRRLAMTVARRPANQAAIGGHYGRSRELGRAPLSASPTRKECIDGGEKRYYGSY